jgi:DHA1 family purine ribonucleoside efflux pump-like MFS transporter
VTATAAFGAFAALSTPLVATQIERRVLLWSLMALLFVSDALTAAAVNLPMLFVARALLGLCVGSFWSLAGAVVVRLASAGAFPRAMSVLFTGVSLATVLAAPTAAYVASLWGWRTGYELATALAGLAALFQVFTVPRLGRGSAAGWSEYREVIGRPAIFVALVSVLLLVAGHFAAFTYIRSLLEQVTRLDVPAISTALLAFGLAAFAGNLVGAALAERSPRRATLTGATIITLALAALSVGADSASAAWPALVAWGAAFAIVIVGYQTWVTSEAADRPEVAGGLLAATFQVSIASGAMAGGLVVDRLGPTSVVQYAALAGLAAVALLVLYLRAQKPRLDAARETAGAEDESPA